MSNRKLSVILIVGLALRLIMGIPLLSNPERMLQNDSPSYLKVAENLKNGNGYSNCPEAPFYKDVLRTPTYPMLLAGLKVIGEDYRLIFILQLILDLFTLILLYKIGFALFDERSALIASGFYAFSIINVVLCAQVLAETSFVLLIVASLYYLIVKQKFLLSGIVLGIAVLCKPIALYLFVVYLVYLLARKEGLRSFVSFIIPVLILVGGWMLRNQKITNSFTISSISAYNLYAYNANMILSKESGKPESVLREERLATVYAKTEGKLGDYSGHYDYIKIFNKEGKDVIIDNIGLYTYLHLMNSVNSFIPGVQYVLQLFGKTEGNRGTMDVLRKDGLITAAKAYFNGRWGSLFVLTPWILIWFVMLAAAFFGGGRLLKEKKLMEILLLVISGLYFVFISGPAAEPRFGALAAPYFCLLGGYYLGEKKWIKNDL